MKADFAAVVAENWRLTTGYLVVGREPCITIARDEQRHVRRRLILHALEEVDTLKPSGSWFMAAIVCLGDDLSDLSAWAGQYDATRIHLYLHADAKTEQLVPWRSAGLPLDRVDQGFTTWGSLHKVLGWDLNVRVYDDHRPS